VSISSQFILLMDSS